MGYWKYKYQTLKEDLKTLDWPLILAVAGLGSYGVLLMFSFASLTFYLFPDNILGVLGIPLGGIIWLLSIFLIIDYLDWKDSQ